MIDKTIATSTLIVALLLIPVFQNGSIVMDTIYGVGETYINSTKEIAVEIGVLMSETKDYYAELTDKTISTYMAIGDTTINAAYSSFSGITELGKLVLYGVSLQGESLASLGDLWNSSSNK